MAMRALRWEGSSESSILRIRPGSLLSCDIFRTVRREGVSSQKYASDPGFPAQGQPNFVSCQYPDTWKGVRPAEVTPGRAEQTLQADGAE